MTGWRGEDPAGGAPGPVDGSGAPGPADAVADGGSLDAPGGAGPGGIVVGPGLGGEPGGPAPAGTPRRPDPASGRYRALLCVTACARLPWLRCYLPLLAAFTARDERFHLVVALDGDDPGYRDFCRRWEVPLVWSEAREGVGLSRNRVLERHPDYDHYLFLEDDVELVDGSALPTLVAVARAAGIHHLSLFEAGGLRKPVGHSTVLGLRVDHGLFGGGHLSFYTREALERVGGWHPRFATWRRWGHTEHSWRVHRAGLAPAPFNVVEELTGSFVWHYPPAVSTADALPRDEDQLVAPERELLEDGPLHVPVTTRAPHHGNGIPPGVPRRLAALVEPGERYPLADGREHRRCRSGYHLWRAGRAAGAGRAAELVRAALAWPGNPGLRRHLRRRWRAHRP